MQFYVQYNIHLWTKNILVIRREYSQYNVTVYSSCPVAKVI